MIQHKELDPLGLLKGSQGTKRNMGDVCGKGGKQAQAAQKTVALTALKQF